MLKNVWTLAACAAALLCAAAPAADDLWRAAAPWWSLGDGGNDGRGIPGGFADFAAVAAPVPVSTPATSSPSAATAW